MARIVSDRERFKLYHGPYAAPKCAVGRLLYCQCRRRRLKVGGMTDAPIQWPYRKGPGPRSLIVCADLARAVRTESVLAVAHHWGVARETVWKWRSALGVPMRNDGSSRLYQVTQADRYDPDSLERARRRSRTPKARAKMSAARKGRPPHPNRLAGARKAALAPKSESFKRKHARRMKREWKLGLRRGHPAGRRWTDAEIARVGTDTDAVIAGELGRTIAAVTRLRVRLTIPIFEGARPQSDVDSSARSSAGIGAAAPRSAP